MQYLFKKELFDAVIDSIDGFRFDFIEAHRRDSEKVERSGAMINASNCTRFQVVVDVNTYNRLGSNLDTTVVSLASSLTTTLGGK